MNVSQHVQSLLQEIGDGRMMNVAYDTAWAARLSELGEPMGEEALEWLRANQLEDGSWGAAEPLYHHDRMICTLTAIAALARHGQPRDRGRLRRGLGVLEASRKKLAEDPAGETIAFEMIAPVLMAEVESLGLLEPGQMDFGQTMTRARAAKLAKSPKGMINRFVTMAFSAEMAGHDGVHLLDVENLQEENGSVACSPSATAYFVLNVSQDNEQALSYLRSVFVGGMPDVAPFDTFELAWTLWNLALAEPLAGEFLALCQPHLDTLEDAWLPENGAGHTAAYPLKDGDDTAVVFEVLRRFDRSVDLNAIEHYEEDEHFRCFVLESNASISTNIHVLSALRQAGLETRHTSVRKVLRFLRQRRTENKYWMDKWHASPYYTTAHAIIAAAGYCDNLIADAVDWILATQRVDGSWGYYMPSAEETAYALQALACWKQQGGKVPSKTLKDGALWLADHMEPPYPPLWIGKCLYCPVLVVRSAVLSALLLTHRA